MPGTEHVHIITAGETIYSAYATTVRDNKDITHTFVFADTELYTNSNRDGEVIRAQKDTAREAVNKIKALAASLKIPASLVYVTPPADTSARDAILKIKKEHPEARFSFDLSAGSKDMCLALFTLSLWVEGDAYYAFCGRKGEALTARLAVPKIPAGGRCSKPELYQNPPDPCPHSGKTGACVTSAAPNVSLQPDRGFL